MSLNRYLNILEKFNNKNNPIANPKKILILPTNNLHKGGFSLSHIKFSKVN